MLADVATEFVKLSVGGDIAPWQLLLPGCPAVHTQVTIQMQKH